MRKYITSPIFYPNSEPHLGTAYTLIICDFLKKAYQALGYEVIFSTGTDEHGKKVETAATQKNISPLEHVIEKRTNFLNLKQILDIDFDCFIGTHSDFHIKAVGFLWRKVKEAGYIYKGKYSGFYSQRDEQYFKEKELINGCAPTGAPVEFIQEDCYFFSLSKFQNKLLEFYEENPDFIQPSWRVNELLSILKKDKLEDLCISRNKNKLSWGIEVPEDKDHVIYVWFDALVNYLSVLGYPYGFEDIKADPLPNGVLPQKYYDCGKEFWKNSIHVIGKDILYFHGIIWPAILMGANLPLPKNLLVHGWLKVEGEKMSKSLGNIIDPRVLFKKYPTDYLKYFLLREIPISSDYDFKESLLPMRINEELADNLGNLINRTIHMINKYFDGIVPYSTLDNILKEKIQEENLPNQLLDHLSHGNISGYILQIIPISTSLNQYIERERPWEANLSKEARAKILYNCIYYLMIGMKFMAPVIPNLSKKFLSYLDIEDFSQSPYNKKIRINGVLVSKIL